MKDDRPECFEDPAEFHRCYGCEHHTLQCAVFVADSLRTLVVRAVDIHAGSRGDSLALWIQDAKRALNGAPGKVWGDPT